jgi:hypothetical protein
MHNANQLSNLNSNPGLLSAPSSILASPSGLGGLAGLGGRCCAHQLSLHDTSSPCMFFSMLHLACPPPGGSSMSSAQVQALLASLTSGNGIGGMLGMPALSSLGSAPPGEACGITMPATAQASAAVYGCGASASALLQRPLAMEGSTTWLRQWLQRPRLQAHPQKGRQTPRTRVRLGLRVERVTGILDA